MFVIEGFS